MKAYSLETFRYALSDYVSVKAPYTDEWRDVAKEIGGRYKFPLVNKFTWQFKLPSDPAARQRVLTDITSVLDRIHPEENGRMPSSIDLNRNGSFTASTAPPQRPWPDNTARGNGTATAEMPATEASTAAKIAKVVAKLVTEDVNQKFQAQDERVQSSLAGTERTVSNALARYSAIVEKVDKRLDEVLRPVYIVVKDRSGAQLSAKEVPTPHKSFEKLVRIVNALPTEMRNVWIPGPTGSGKTTAAKQLADALDLPFFFNGAIDTEYKLSGFIDAQGRIVSTQFRKAAESERGAVYLFDECDRSLNGALLAFNAHLSHGWFVFPDCVLMRPERMIVLATGNTWGFGGDANYVGANKIDAAFLNRFPTKLHWDYDEDMERRLAIQIGGNLQGESGSALALRWFDVVRRTRILMRDNSAKMIVSPRITYAGVHLLLNGMTKQETVELTFGDLMTHDKWSVVGRHAMSFGQEA